MVLILNKVELQKLEDYMSTLTDKEKYALVSVIGKGNSYAETAAYFEVSKSTVQSYVKRDMLKIERSIKHGAQTSLF